MPLPSESSESASELIAPGSSSESERPKSPETDAPSSESERPERAEPTGQKGPEKENMCRLCKNEKAMPPGTRCKHCNRLYERVRKAAKRSRGEGYIEVWDNMDKDKRNEFIRSAKDLTGKNLKARLQIFVDEESEWKKSISHSPFDKPAQLSCPDRKCYICMRTCSTNPI